MSKLNPNNNVTPVSHIIVSGAKENNLKNISLSIPKKKLVVLTGVSGSGKSSLAFDTIYAESQRRYLDSLSSYVRQFLGNSKKPDVDAIEGLSPSISIDQKTTSHNPRSTVGTVTEIYDYLRLLYARIGIPTCPKGHGPIKTVTIKNIVDQVMELADQTKIQILSPIVRNEKGTLKIHLEKLKKNGFLRVMLDGVSYNLDQELEVNKNQRHNLAIIVDRIILRHDKTTYSRLYAGIELACEESHGLVSLQVQNNDQVVKIINFSKHYACMKCGFSIPELEPRLFSFNSPIGACRGCNGLGFSYEPDRNKIFLHPDRSIIDGGIDYFKNTVNTSSFDWQKFEHLLKHYDISLFKPINAMTPQEINWLFYGSDDSIQIRIRSASGKKYESFEPIEGIGTLIKRRHQETQSEGARDFYTKYMSETRCDLCCGQKLSSVALSVLLGGKNIIQVTELSIQDAVNFFFNLTLTDQQQKIGKLVLKEIIDRLNFLLDVGLSYLNLSRNAASLSGGELQRIRLASQIGSALTGVLYVLDEPSIGLHQRDNHKLINTIKKMRDLGNTILVVEHDDETMLAADWLIEIGPEAGPNGGEVVVEGELQEILKNTKSITANYLTHRQTIPLPKARRTGNGKKIVLKKASGNNLKKIDVTFPLGNLIAITGVSGSGKSTLINEVLVHALKEKLSQSAYKSSNYQSIMGYQHIERVIEVSQDPIGRTTRSNPATYVGVFNDIRDLFTLLPLAKERGYLKGRFSFNVAGGRCERCQGDGVNRIEMHFLPDVYVTCEECKGKKYNDETLSIKYKGKSIFDVLEMTVTEGKEFFANNPLIYHKLKLMEEVGIGYLKLGTNSNFLSGGEAQRIKLAKFLQKKPKNHSLFVLDEPTTGLHNHDIANLIQILNRIVDGGDTVIIIEHNLELIKTADYIIDLGPEGGDQGGHVVVSGTPEQICANDHGSYTAHYLKRYLA